MHSVGEIAISRTSRAHACMHADGREMTISRTSRGRACMHADGREIAISRTSRARAHRSTRAGCAPVIRRNQSQSVAISRNQSQSVAMR